MNAFANLPSLVGIADIKGQMAVGPRCDSCRSSRHTNHHHTHIRDCNQPDARSMALESGRYMETVESLSMSFDDRYFKNLAFNC